MLLLQVLQKVGAAPLQHLHAAFQKVRTNEAHRQLDTRKIGVLGCAAASA